MTELRNADDFKWYKAKLDLDGREEHTHHGEPTHYPCRVVSSYDPDDPGCTRRASYPSYEHTFTYMVRTACPQCGHTTLGWPGHNETTTKPGEHP